jgi:ketosteroid isomerase-like protein
VTKATVNKDLHGFEQFMKQREVAASAYVSGDAAPVGRLVTHDSPASFFGPMGGYVEGAEEVWSTHELSATQFRPGGESKLEILQMGASDGIAYWVGLQHAVVHMGKSANATPMSLRVTEVFRKEDDAWKLIHRHADMLATKPEPAKTKQEME